MAQKYFAKLLLIHLTLLFTSTSCRSVVKRETTVNGEQLNQENLSLTSTAVYPTDITSALMTTTTILPLDDNNHSNYEKLDETTTISSTFDTHHDITSTTASLTDALTTTLSSDTDRYSTIVYDDQTESSTTSNLVDNLVVETTTAPKHIKNESVPISIKDEVGAKNTSKKAKFLSLDEGSNVNNETLPNGADVWALVSLKNLLPEAVESPQPTKNSDLPNAENKSLQDNTLGSPETLLVKWSEVMKIMNDSNDKSPSNSTTNLSTKINESHSNNNDLTYDYSNVADSKFKESTISSTISSRLELSTTTSKAFSVDNNRIDVDPFGLHTNKSIPTTKIPTTLTPKQEFDVTPDKNIEITDVLEVNNEVKNKMDQVKAFEGKTNIIFTTTEYPMTTTTFNDFTTIAYGEEYDTTTDSSDEVTYYGENESSEQDEISKRTVPTDFAGIWTTEPPEYSTTGSPNYISNTVDPRSFAKTKSKIEITTSPILSSSTSSDNLQSFSTENFSKTDTTPLSTIPSHSENPPIKTTISTKLPFTSTQSMISTKQSINRTLPSVSTEQSTTVQSIIEFKPMATSESTNHNDSKLYEYNTVKNTDPVFAASSTTFTTEFPPSTFSYHPKIKPKGHTIQLDTEDVTEDFVSTVGAIGGQNDTTDINSIIIISVTVLSIVIVLVIIGALIFIRKRKNQQTTMQRCRPVGLDAYSLDNISVYNSVRRKFNSAANLRLSKRSYGNSAFEDPSLKSNLLDIKLLQEFATRKTAIYEEFKEIPQISVRTDEVPQGCEDKNRYANVIPANETRVFLKRLQEDDEKSEYINANYVKGPTDMINYYIATQAPLNNTVQDFWRMIWEQNSKVIVMLTDLTENGVERCAEYIPASIVIDNMMTFQDFQVTLKSREVRDKYAHSIIHLKNLKTNTWREIMHFWYKWPESGCPTDESSIISLLLEARSYLRSSLSEQLDENSNESRDKSQTLDKTKSLQRTQGPLTVLCSPGTGRTGTLIACDIILRQLEIPPRKIDVPKIVYNVRRGRSNAIKSRDQYEFIYKVASAYALKLVTPSVEN